MDRCSRHADKQKMEEILFYRQARSHNLCVTAGSVYFTINDDYSLYKIGSNEQNFNENCCNSVSLVMIIIVIITVIVP